MPLTLFAHPFASYCQKVLIALYENAIPFTYRMLDGEHAENWTQFTALWPVGKFPLLLDGNRPVMESTTIIEYLDIHYPGPAQFIPRNPDAAIAVRMLDRIFDNHIMNQMQRIVADALRPPERRDRIEVEEAKSALEKGYGWLDDRLAGREWAASDALSLADCAAAPALFYADWAHPIAERFGNLKAYRARLLARPSIARVVDEARPYRPLFPLGAPDRD